MIKYQKEFAIILFPWIRTNPWIIIDYFQTMYRTEQQTNNLTT